MRAIPFLGGKTIPVGKSFIHYYPRLGESRVLVGGIEW